MSFEIMGLSLRHFALVLNGLALLLALFYTVVITNFRVPTDDVHIYLAIPATVAFSLMSLAGISRISGKVGIAIGYALIAENIFFTGSLALIAISYIEGPNSVAWHLMP